MSLELKSELVRTRQSGAATTKFGAADALFSLDLEGIVDLMDPNRGSFTVMELVAYKVDLFPNINTDVIAEGTAQVPAAGTRQQTKIERSIDFDTSVPDASQPATEAAFLNTDERWLASATKVARDSVRWMHLKGSNDGEVTVKIGGTDFARDWVTLRNEDGKGPLIAAPRLIVRYAIWMHSPIANAASFTDPIEDFQLRLRYRTRKLSKTQMWRMLLQQTPGETLIRSGSAAFP